tara:strand:+ start:131 stop:424 length:294 start_codon:yes stop_codon:yes gene_type:complete
MLVKVHTADGRVVISIADDELIGKEFEEGEKYLKVSEYFYNGDVLEEKEILKLFENANSANIIGKDSVKFAIKHKIVDKDNILKVENVPCAIVIFDE